MKVKKSMLANVVLILIVFIISSCSNDDDTSVLPVVEVNDCEPYTPTPASGAINGTWEVANERDVYSNLIIIPSDPGGGYVKIELTQSDEDLIPALFVDNDLSAGGTIIGGSAALTNDESSRTAYFSVHPGASFSVEVFPFFNTDAYPVDYTIEWEFMSRVDCFEKNDTQDQAKKILFDETIEAYAIAGYIDYYVGSLDDNTYDWYKVELDETKMIEAEVLEMPSDMRITMRLFNTDGSTEPIDFEWLDPDAPNSNGRRSKITSIQALNPGTYFIELHADFVASRISNNDLEPVPEHFNKTYKIRAKKI